MPEPIKSGRVPWQDWRHDDEIRLRFRPLHDRSDAHVGVCIQELPPGCRTSPAHYHLKEEEHVFVIEVAERALLAIVYRDHAAPGLVRRWTQSAAHRLEDHYDALTEARVL